MKWSAPIKICSYIASEYTIPINSRYLVQSFSSLVAEILELKDILTNFLISSIWIRTTLTPIKEESTVKKSEWFVWVNVSATSFLMDVETVCYQFNIPRKSITNN